MRLIDWQERIKLLCPSFKQRVYLTINETALENIPLMSLPQAFIMAMSEKAEPSQVEHKHRQTIKQYFGVFIITRNAGDTAIASASAQELELLKDELKTALNGWLFESQTHKAVNFVTSHGLPYKKEAVLWLNIFETTYIRYSQ